MPKQSRRPREKRPNGEGGVWYSSTEGRWRARYTDQNGIPRNLSSKSEAEVTRRLDRAIAERDAGTLGGLPSKQPTVGEWLDDWLRSRDDLKPRTRERYALDIDQRIAPLLGAIRIDKVTPIQIEAAYGKLRARLAAKTVAHVHAVLRAAFREAYRLGVVSVNVMDRVRAPKTTPHEIVPPTVDEVAKVLAAARADGPMTSARWMLALRWGPRQGEALGLRWSDIDLETGKVSIRQAVQRQRGQGLVFDTPKSRAGTRAYTVDEDTRRALVAWRKEQALLRLASDRWTDLDLVFTTRHGGPVERGTDSRKWKRLLQAAGVRHYRVHDARHSAATYLLESGVTGRRVMEILGHSQISLTMNTYAHVSIEALTEDAGRVGAFYARAQATNSG